MQFFKSRLSKFLGGHLISKTVWWFFIYTAILFFLSVIMGWLIYSLNQETVSEEIGEFFNSMAWLKNLSPWTIFIIIFLNNLIKIWLVIISGLLFGLGPAIFVTVNGLLLGMIGFESLAALGWGRTLILLLPHGIIELTVFFMAAAWGFHLGHIVLLWSFGKKEKEIIKQNLLQAYRWGYKIIPLWVLGAALVEVFVTPLIDYLLYGF
ncbi:MAG: stage II sporulation protein M [Patescibacteria group bacterium]